MPRFFLISTLIALTLITGPAAADVADQKARMEKLSALLGEWEGTSWQTIRGGERVAMRSHELVESRLDGLIYIVEGTHHLAEGERAGELALNAVAVLSAEPEGDGYDWRSYTHEGHGGDFDAKVDDEGRFVWWIEHPRAGTIRYTITLTETTWNEVGERSADGGESWQAIFGMELQRVE